MFHGQTVHLNTFTDVDELTYSQKRTKKPTEKSYSLPCQTVVMDNPLSKTMINWCILNHRRMIYDIDGDRNRKVSCYY